jgi:hypothetical protein
MSLLIKTLVAEYNKTKKEFMEKARNALRGAFNEFFDANPEIGQVVWTQYTPYFNDGDECVFSVHDMFFNFVTFDGEPEDYEDDDADCYGASFYSYKGETDPISEQRAAFKNFTHAIRGLPDEIFKDSFGDHVKVIANRDGFNIQEYEHE